MFEEIQHYWDTFAALQDHLFDGPENTSNHRQVLDDLTRNAQLLCDDIDARRDTLANLSSWAAEYYRLIGQIEIDLKRPHEGAAAYAKALEFHYEIETSVWLIKALAEAGNAAEAIFRIKELHDRGESFESSNDAESACKLLLVVGTYPEIAQSVDANVLQDALRCISNTGIDVLKLKPVKPLVRNEPQ